MKAFALGLFSWLNEVYVLSTIKQAKFNSANCLHCTVQRSVNSQLPNPRVREHGLILTRMCVYHTEVAFRPSVLSETDEQTLRVHRYKPQYDFCKELWLN
jgi:hypothetical protein